MNEVEYMYNINMGKWHKHDKMQRSESIFFTCLSTSWKLLICAHPSAMNPRFAQQLTVQ